MAMDFAGEYERSIAATVQCSFYVDDRMVSVSNVETVKGLIEGY